MNKHPGWAEAVDLHSPGSFSKRVVLCCAISGGSIAYKHYRIMKCSALKLPSFSIQVAVGRLNHAEEYYCETAGKAVWGWPASLVFSVNFPRSPPSSPIFPITDGYLEKTLLNQFFTCVYKFGQVNYLSGPATFIFLTLLFLAMWEASLQYAAKNVAAVTYAVAYFFQLQINYSLYL